MTTPLAELVTLRRRWKAEGQSVALAYGCFELLHPGHVALLEAARAHADRLIVALNSDASVRRSKGADRPLLPEQERAEALLALEAVDRVLIYEQDTPAELIAALLPDVLVKGADWAADAIVGRELVEGAGGRVLRAPASRRNTSTSLRR